MSNMPPPPPDDSDFSSMPPPPPAMGAGSEVSNGSVTLDTGETLQLAEPWRRLVARLVDIVILFISFSIILGVLGVSENQVLPLLLAAVYEIVFTALKGQTPGKMILRIKIVRASNGYLPSWGQAAIRWAIPIVGFVFLVLPGLLVWASLLWNKRKQGWHDMAGRTLVIKTETA